MFTDIAGYTALMGEDEDRAVEVLARCRSIVRPQVEKYGGRIPNARLVVLETDNHAIPAGDPTYPEFLEAIDSFLAEDPEMSAAGAGR